MGFVYLPRDLEKKNLLIFFVNETNKNVLLFLTEMIQSTPNKDKSNLENNQ